jgi:uroporphyrinogen decarboxylase
MAQADTMNHRKRLERTLTGGPVDRPPVALWRHFPVDDQTPEGLAAAALDFQHRYDFDFIKVTPASSFCLKDWGVEDAWRGAVEGTREYTRRVIHNPEDWAALPMLDPTRGRLGAQLKCLRLLVAEVGGRTPVIQTIFSPLAQAKNLAGEERLLVHLRRYPQAVKAGLQIVARTTRRFIEAALKTGIDGVFYAVQHAQFGVLSLEEYRIFGKPFDLQVLAPVDRLWFNVLHLHGSEVMFTEFIDYPLQVVNWHDRETPPSLSEAQAQCSKVVCGGLQRWNTMVLGAPEEVEREAQEAIRATGGRRFILGTGCVVPTIVPRANLLAARRSVESQH